MAQNSKIEWTHHTVNLWWGCTEVHDGCDNCYAKVLSHRWGKNLWGNEQPRQEIKSVWKDLDRYQKLAKAAGERHRVFVGSMNDIFEKPMPMINSKGEKLPITTESVRNRLFQWITDGMYPNLIFLLLTKRPGNINKYIPERWKYLAPENVMFGTSPVDQKTFDKLVPQLEQVTGWRFLSIEPQLSELKLNFASTYSIDWIIQGGESGHHKRPFNIEWAHYMKKHCEDTGIPYFFKQIDKIQEIPDDLLIRQFPKMH